MGGAAREVWLELLRWSTDRAAERCVFRGHANSDWKLIPSIGRERIDPVLSDLIGGDERAFSVRDERRVAEEFRRLGLPLVSVRPETPLEWLALAQHYGAPTRLLDWTANPLVAVWFAASKHVEQDANVFACDPAGLELDPAIFKEAGTDLGRSERRSLMPSRVEASDDALDAVGFFKVPVLAPRMGGQNGLFSWQSVPYRDLRELFAGETRPRVEVFRIERAWKAEILVRLSRFGIDEASLFGDLAGVGRSVNWRYGERKFLLEED